VTDAPRFLVVGAGISGAVIARELADAGCPCEVVDARSHVAGHCHTERDAETGVLMHIHGPHTFHASDDSAWVYVTRFSDVRPYQHEKFAVARGIEYEFPINLNTLRRFFGRDFSSQEARAFVAKQAVKLGRPPRNFEEAGITTVGRELYNAFYRGYTTKQWGRDPTALPASLFGRVPIHFDAGRNYFHHTRQGPPRRIYRTRGEHAKTPADHGPIGSPL